MSEANDKVLEEFRITLRRLLNTADGQLVLENLNSMYVEASCLGDTTEITYYKLGQKEFVQSLIKEANRSDAEIKDLTAVREGE